MEQLRRVHLCNYNRQHVTVVSGQHFIALHSTNTVQVAQLSQRDRDAGCVIVFAKSRRLELGDNILGIL